MLTISPAVAAGLSDAPSNGHPYARKDGAWVRLEDSAIYMALFATNVTDIAAWSVVGDTPILDGTTVKFANPGSVTAINDTDGFTAGATLDFSALTGLTSIGADAFNPSVYGERAYLTGTLTLPDSLLTIGDSAFISREGFTGALVIPNNVTTIGEWAFAFCYGFDGPLTLGSSVTTIGYRAFRAVPFTGTLIIPNSVTTIAGSVFQSCEYFTELTIFSGVTSIGTYAFSYCSGLTRVNAYIAKSVLDVTGALDGTGVTEIHARAADGTWTAGAGQTIGEKSGITVIKDL